MLDIKDVRADPEKYKQDLIKRGRQDLIPALEELQVLDKDLRVVQQTNDLLKQEINILSRMVSDKKKLEALRKEKEVK